MTLLLDALVSATLDTGDNLTGLIQVLGVPIVGACVLFLQNAAKKQASSNADEICRRLDVIERRLGIKTPPATRGR